MPLQSRKIYRNSLDIDRFILVHSIGTMIGAIPVALCSDASTGDSYLIDVNAPGWEEYPPKETPRPTDHYHNL